MAAAIDGSDVRSTETASETGDASQREEGVGDAEVDSGLQVIDLELEDSPDSSRDGMSVKEKSSGDAGLETSGMSSLSLQDSCEIEQVKRILSKSYQFPLLASELLKHLNDLRLARQLVDVTLASSDGREFMCHRAVLAASSPYFSAMFTDDLLESHSDRIELGNVKGATLETILHAVYMCEVNISQDNVQDLLATAHFLSYPHIVDSCCQYLKDSLLPQNCLGISQLAETYVCRELQNQAWDYALKNFRAVSTGQEFLQVKTFVLEKLVSSDELNVSIEDEVLEAVLRWAESDVINTRNLPSVFSKVRLPLVSDVYLRCVMNSNKVLHSSGKVLTLVKDAQNLKELARKGKRRDHHLLRPRYCMRSEALVIVGGMAENREWVPHVSCLDPKTAEWSAMASLPFDHSDYSAASVDDAIYVTGGFHRDKGTISDVWRYDEMHDKWSKVEPLIVPRFNHTAIGYKNHIYVLGGEDSERTLTGVERYSPDKDRWEMIGTINPTGSGMAVVALQDKLYIIGWLTNVRLMCVVQSFDLETLECTIIPSSGLNRQLFPAVALNNSIFILGGNRIKEVAVYDPETFTSRKAESMRFKRNTPSATVVGGKIYVTGGELRQHVSRVECYDPELDLWDVVTPMPHAVCFHGCVMIKRYLGPPYT